MENKHDNVVFDIKKSLTISYIDISVVFKFLTILPGIIFITTNLFYKIESKKTI